MLVKYTCSGLYGEIGINLNGIKKWLCLQILSRKRLHLNFIACNVNEHKFLKFCLQAF